MPAAKPRAAFFSDDPGQIGRVFGAEAHSRIQTLTNLVPGIHGLAALTQPSAELAQVEVAFSTWGMPALEPAQLQRLPKLKAVFYAAGTVRYFAAPLLEHGLTVVSAWAANAEPVAEFTLAQILLAGKGFLPASLALRQRQAQAWTYTPDCPGNYGTTVALLGAGMVGRRVIEMLRPLAFKVLVFDPFLGADAAKSLGVEKVSLEEAFARGQVVSNHLADVPETRGLLKAPHFLAMLPRASFLNTGRGATVDEAGLWQVLLRRPDLHAVLDVTDPEPPVAGSPAYSLPNVTLSPHLAGSLGNELQRMSALAIDECEAWLAGRPLRYSVSLDMLEKMA